MKKGPLDDVHVDKRGEIHRYEFKGTKYNVLYTKKGALSSGDYHPNTQYDLILKGEFEITLRKGGEYVVIHKKDNELIIIPPNTPHLFRSLTDTVMIEWWDGEFGAK